MYNFPIAEKEIKNLTDNDLINIKLSFSHEYYYEIKKRRDLILRNKKINKILNK